MPEDVEQDLSDLLEEINDKDFHDYYLGVSISMLCLRTFIRLQMETDELEEH